MFLSWGIPRASDVGSIAVKVVERKQYPTPGSPTRHSMASSYSTRSVEGVEQLVGRFVLDVTDAQRG